MINNLSFGYGEMYEWADNVLSTHNSNESFVKLYGKFVTFDELNPERIRIANKNDKYILGVSSNLTNNVSDNPNEWQGKYLINEVGIPYISKDYIETGKLCYDSELELEYIDVKSYIELNSEINSEFDLNKKYVKRSSRKEWINVILLGKAIIEDDGSCIPGYFCKPDKNGCATIDNDNKGYYVLSRISKNSIIIILK